MYNHISSFVRHPEFCPTGKTVSIQAYDANMNER